MPGAMIGFLPNMTGLGCKAEIKPGVLIGQVGFLPSRMAKELHDEALFGIDDNDCDRFEECPIDEFIASRREEYVPSCPARWVVGVCD